MAIISLWTAIGRMAIINLWTAIGRLEAIDLLTSISLWTAIGRLMAIYPSKAIGLFVGFKDNLATTWGSKITYAKLEEIDYKYVVRRGEISLH